MIDHVILVQPPQRGLLDGFSCGLVDLANYIAARQPGLDLSILDLAMTSGNALVSAASGAIKGKNGRLLVGITTTTASYQSALDVARAFKAVASECIVGLGGHHASPQHEVILSRHQDAVDIIFRGEGERSLLAYVRGIKERDVPGISFRQHGRVIANPSGPLLSTEDLDTLSVEFRGRNYQSAPGKFDHVTYVSARGCPLHCSFCAVAGERIRAKSIGRVIEDLRYLVAAKGYQRIAIEDNFFAQAKKRTVSLCLAISELRRELSSEFTWDCQTRVESVKDPEVLFALEVAGCEAVYLGVEALTADELMFLGKTPQPEHYLSLLAEQVVPRLTATSVSCYMNLQVGLPFENRDTRVLRASRLAQLGKIAAENRKRITVFPQLNVIYPGTAQFWRAVQECRFGPLGGSIFEEFTEWEAEERPVLKFLGENFAHGVGGLPIGILDDEYLRQGEFKVCEEKIEALKSHLAAIELLEGIDIFRYGVYLTATAL